MSEQNPLEIVHLLEKESAPTPEWLYSLCPDIPTTLPKTIIEELRKTEEDQLASEELINKTLAKQGMTLSDVGMPPDEKSVRLRILARWLNNFHCYFSHQLNSTRFLLEEKEPDTQMKKEKNTSSSPRRIGQNNQEFLREIDTTLVACNRSSDEIKRLIDERSHAIDKNQAALSRDALNALNIYLLPVFLALRKQGYSQRDLAT